MELLSVSLKKSKKRQFNTGMTMLETIVAVALVSVFFTVVATVLPATLEQYVLMRKTSDALTIASVVHNGIESEISTSYHPKFYSLEAFENGGATLPSKVYPSGNADMDISDYGLRYTSKNHYHYFPENSGTSNNDTLYSYSYDYDPDSLEVTKYSITCVGRPTIYGSVTDRGFYDKYFVKITVEYNKLNSTAISKVVVYEDSLLDEGVSYQSVLDDTDNTKIDTICKTNRTILMYN